MITSFPGKISYLWIGLLFCLSVSGSASAKDYTFSWSASPEPVDGYNLYYKKGGDVLLPFAGNDAVQGPSPIDTGKVTTFTISGLEDGATYHFALTAYNSTAESDFSPIITVFPETTSADLAASEEMGPAPLAVDFDASDSTGSITGYTWNFGDGSGTTGITASHTFSGPGSYNVTLTVTDTTGHSDQGEVEIEVYDPNLEANIEIADQRGRAPFIAEFDGSTSTGLITGYRWDFGDGITSTAVKPIHIYTIPGIYTASLSVEDSFGQQDQAGVQVTVNEPAAPSGDQPTASINPANPTGAAPLTVLFNGSGSTSPAPPIILHVWDFGDGNSAEAESPAHTYNTPGIYTATLVVVDSAGQIDQFSVPVVVTGSATPGGQNPTAVIKVEPERGAAPLTVSFDASGSLDGDGSITGYHWNFGDGFNCSTRACAHTYSEPGIYNTTLMVTDNGGNTGIATTPLTVLTEKDEKDNSIKTKVLEGVYHLMLQSD